MAHFLTQTMMDQLNAIPEPPGLVLAELVAEAMQPATDPSQFYDDNNLPSEAMVLYDALGDASEAGDLAAVQVSLAKFRAGLGENSHRRLEKPLRSAVRKRHYTITKYLLSEGIEATPTVVKQAIKNKDKVGLQLLFENAWPINKAFQLNEPPALAYALDDPDMTRWLLAQGADPNASCMMNKTALSTAVRECPFPVIKVLLSHVGQISPGSLLHMAIFRTLGDRKAVVDYLLQHGAPINEPLHWDSPTAAACEFFALGTPLYHAAAGRDVEMVRFLLERGADADARSSHGDTALQKAQAKGHAHVVQCLRDHSDSTPRL